MGSIAEVRFGDILVHNFTMLLRNTSTPVAGGPERLYI